MRFAMEKKDGSIYGGESEIQIPNLEGRDKIKKISEQRINGCSEILNKNFSRKDFLMDYGLSGFRFDTNFCLCCILSNRQHSRTGSWRSRPGRSRGIPAPCVCPRCASCRASRQRG